MARKSAAALAAEAAEAAAAAQAADLEACLKFMHVDPDSDDIDQIRDEFIPAAKAYLRGSGIVEPPEGSDPLDVALYTLAWHSLTLHYYDHRDAVGEEQSFPTGLRPIINQLKHTAEAPL
jgi:hypothetical protein